MAHDVTFDSDRPPIEVINAWTRCGKVEKADKILLEMEKAYYGGGAEGTTPNVVSYTTLMNGYVSLRHSYLL